MELKNAILDTDNPIAHNTKGQKVNENRSKMFQYRNNKKRREEKMFSLGGEFG